MAQFWGVRTRVLLIAALIAVISTVTGGSLLIVRDRVRRHVAQDLSADLAHSLATFQNMQQQRREELIHENALLADLPSLKALMTTRDQRTIADDALGYWKISGSDLFALVDNYGRVVTVYTQGAPPGSALADGLALAITQPRQHYIAAEGRLFDFSVRPLYFGDETDGTLLGYVISGYLINRDVVGMISRASGDDATFLAGDSIVASTLSPQLQRKLQMKLGSADSITAKNTGISLGGEQFLVTEADLSDQSAGRLRLVVLKSFEQANRATREINRLVLLLGIAAILLGSLLMIALSRVVTGPLELLAQGVRAFGGGDPSHGLPQTGTLEVRELSAAFARMRSQILVANSALLEAERLATIGSMASSVSHDLRHYLAAVYANSEFLSSPRLSQEERTELFADIQSAVFGATELLDSLLIFSKTGVAFRRERHFLPRIVEKAVALLKAHPEAEGVAIHMDCEASFGGYAEVDAKQMQRAIYNLLLNACQSARQIPNPGQVSVSISRMGDFILLNVIDSGPGVPEHIRDSLFEPFVSDGKQRGTGLGLTLAHLIAKEHGGSVILLSTRPGETIFQLSLRDDSGVAANEMPEKRKPSFPTAGGTSQ